MNEERNDQYVINEKNGVYVGWFGIVRMVRAEDEQTTLTVEHKYFDGLTDSHIQTVLFNGAGEFRVILPGTNHQIDTLELVKIYGTASVTPNQPIPVVHADFVRSWGGALASFK